MSKAERSNSWRMTTHDRNDPELLTLKAKIKMVNAIHRKMGIPERKRVLVRGRVPIKGSKYDWAGNIVGGLESATRMDVYAYQRYNCLYKR